MKQPTSKEIMYQFTISLWRDGWIDIGFNDYPTEQECKEWFEHQYKSRTTSTEKKQLES